MTIFHQGLLAKIDKSTKNVTLIENPEGPEAAGINLGLEKNKVKDLIVKSAEADQERKREYNIEFQLGIRS